VTPDEVGLVREDLPGVTEGGPPWEGSASLQRDVTPDEVGLVREDLPGVTEGGPPSEGSASLGRDVTPDEERDTVRTVGPVSRWVGQGRPSWSVT